MRMINGNHGNHGASGQQPENWGAGFTRCRFQQLGGAKYGVGLLNMAFWHGLSGTIGLQCSTAFTKGDARCIEGCKEYSNDSLEPTFAWRRMISRFNRVTPLYRMIPCDLPSYATPFFSQPLSPFFLRSVKHNIRLVF